MQALCLHKLEMSRFVLRRGKRIAHNYCSVRTFAHIDMKLCYTLQCRQELLLLCILVLPLILFLKDVMDITVAYFQPFLHPDMVKRDFDQIRASGASSIVYTVHDAVPS